MTFDPDTGEILEYPIREVFQRFFHDYSAQHPLSRQQAKAASCICRCKTGELGLNASFCPECGHTQVHNRSCNNRDCPSCQAPKEQKWIMERNSELIEKIAYYHVIFTLPSELNDLILINQELLYNLLFQCASDTLLTLCRDKKHMRQQLTLHPHLHIMISRGGPDPFGNFIETRHKGFIIPTEVIGAMFRGKYMAALKKLGKQGKLTFSGNCQKLQNRYNWKEFIDCLYGKAWCPFVKETFNGNGSAIDYLARYAYRTAISNSRIETVTESEVTFCYTDYADGNAKKQKTVSGEEFIRLFLTHVLPKGFHRVRFSGYLSNCRKSKALKQIHRLRRTKYAGNPTKGKNTAELMLMIYGINICNCPLCNHLMINSMGIRPPKAVAN